MQPSASKLSCSGEVENLQSGMLTTPTKVVFGLRICGDKKRGNELEEFGTVGSSPEQLDPLNLSIPVYFYFFSPTKSLIPTQAKSFQ